MYSRRKYYVRFLIFALISPLLGCELIPVEFINEGFDEWCGESPCGWDVEDGGVVERSPTWHKNDYGAKMIGERVVMSQLATTEAPCLGFEVIADVPEGCALYLEFDVGNDNLEHPEKSVRIPSGDWQVHNSDVPMPDWAGSDVRIILRKEGSSSAIVALVSAKAGEDCSAAVPADWKRPLGVDCRQPESCAAGFCELIPGYGFFPEDATYCASCSVDADCNSGEACGLDATSFVGMTKICGLTGRHVLGERCAGGAECASSICCEGVCSSCCNDPVQSCPSGQTCSQAPVAQLGIELSMPFQCEPGHHLGAPQSDCIADSDCASNSCIAEETLSLCESNGQPCTTVEDCPLYSEDVDISFDWDSEKCSVLGLKGGYCE